MNEGQWDTYPDGTLRDWFAGKALEALIGVNVDCTFAELAADAYRYAAAMLAEREKVMARK